MRTKQEQQDYRRNLVYSAMLHGAMIAAVLMASAFAPKHPEQAVWIELGSGGEPGGGGEAGNDQEPPPPAPSAAPAPTTPSTPDVAAPTVPEPEVKPTPKPEVRKPDIRRAEIHTEPPKKIEKPQPKPKAEPKPQTEAKKPEQSSIQKSAKLVTRSKTGTTAAASGTASGKSTNAKNAGKGFNASNFKSKLYGMLDRGTAGGVGTGRSGPLTGKGTGRTVGAGTGTGGNSEFGWYYQRIQSTMQAAWQNRPGFTTSLRCVIIVRIQRDGTISNVWFDQKSGDAVMDDSALSAARSVRKVERPPAGLLTGDFVEIGIGFDLNASTGGRG